MKSIVPLLILATLNLTGCVQNAVHAETETTANVKERHALLGINKTVTARLTEYRKQNSSLKNGLISLEELNQIKLLSGASQANVDKRPDAMQGDETPQNEATKKEDRIAQFLTNPGLQLYTVTGVGVPLLTEGKAGRQQAVRTVDALLVGGIVETALKRITRQKRPTGKSYGFPSGHATASFVVAAMQSHYHPRQAVYWYTGAALISASRVKLRRHYVRDVLAGALIGYSIGRWEISRPHGLILSPLITSNEVRRNDRINPNKFSWQFNKSF